MKRLILITQDLLARDTASSTIDHSSNLTFTDRFEDRYKFQSIRLRMWLAVLSKYIHYPELLGTN